MTTSDAINRPTCLCRWKFQDTHLLSFCLLDFGFLFSFDVFWGFFGGGLLFFFCFFLFLYFFFFFFGSCFLWGGLFCLSLVILDILILVSVL